MTNGSCQSRCESNVHTWLNPYVSAWRASSTVREAGGFVCSTTPKSMDVLSLEEVVRGRSEQVLGEPAWHVLAVTRAAAVARLVHHDRPAGDHDVHVPVDLVPLP